MNFVKSFSSIILEKHNSAIDFRLHLPQQSGKKIKKQSLKVLFDNMWFLHLEFVLFFAWVSS